LRDRWHNYRDEFGPRAKPHDVIHEIADGSVPVYTSVLLELACEENSLATDTPELGPAFDGSPSPTNIIAANVYEAVEAALWDEWQQIQARTVELIQAAENLGYDRGTAAGSWVIDGNTTEETARAILCGLDEGDPATLDLLPSSPLSGEWAGGITPTSLRAELGAEDVTEEEAETILMHYEDAYGRGVYDEVVHSARAVLPEPKRYEVLDAARGPLHGPQRFVLAGPFETREEAEAEAQFWPRTTDPRVVESETEGR